MYIIYTYIIVYFQCCMLYLSSKVLGIREICNQILLIFLLYYPRLKKKETRFLKISLQKGGSIQLSVTLELFFLWYNNLGKALKKIVANMFVTLSEIGVLPKPVLLYREGCSKLCGHVRKKCFFIDAFPNPEPEEGGHYEVGEDPVEVGHQEREHHRGQHHS